METQFSNPELLFRSVAQVRKSFNDEGSYWFSKDTIRFFGTSFPKGGPVFDGRFFVSREKMRGEFSLNLFVVREVVYKERPGLDRVYDIITHEGPNKECFRTFGEARAYILGLINSEGAQ